MLNKSNRSFALSAIFLIYIWCFSVYNAMALVGEIDDTDEFPFVVQLKINYPNAIYGCSGSVSRNGLVSTAAHCVWDPKLGPAKSVTVLYKDADDVYRKATSMRIFYPKSYPNKYSAWINSKSTINGSYSSSVQLFHEMTLDDIAYIVTSPSIEVEGFPHWATEALDAPNCAISTDELSTYGDIPPPRCQGVFSLAKLQSVIGTSLATKAMVVGYGNYTCKNFNNREEECLSDSRRRKSELVIIPKIEANGKEYRAPDIWCTGTNIEQINPVQHGDSGGPIFVRSKDGRWIFVGYTSGGNNSGSCGSSIFRHLDLWKEAALYQFKTRKSVSHRPSNSWEKRQMKRFIVEYLASWSSENEASIARLATFYAENDERNALVKAKKKYLETWPRRHFAIRIGSDVSVIRSETGDPLDTVSATIDWSSSNYAGDVVKSGSFKITMVVMYHFDNEIRLAYGSLGTRPTIISEKCGYVSGDLLEDAFGCRIQKNRIFDENSGMRSWNHNNSELSLHFSGSKRKFVYKLPRPGMLAVGVSTGTTLFEGFQIGNEYSGTAYIFNLKCGPQAYFVEGTVADGGKTITMRGKAPVRNSDCKIQRYRQDTLVFSAILEDQ